MIGFLAKLITGGAVKTVAKAVKNFTGDRMQRDQAGHRENMATYGQFSAEFQVQNRTRFDSLIKNGFTPSCEVQPFRAADKIQNDHD